jgi:hypothetical protein
VDELLQATRNAQFAFVMIDEVYLKRPNCLLELLNFDPYLLTVLVVNPEAILHDVTTADELLELAARAELIDVQGGCELRIQNTAVPRTVSAYHRFGLDTRELNSAVLIPLMFLTHGSSSHDVRVTVHSMMQHRARRGLVSHHVRKSHPLMDDIDESVPAAVLASLVCQDALLHLYQQQGITPPHDADWINTADLYLYKPLLKRFRLLLYQLALSLYLVLPFYVFTSLSYSGVQRVDLVKQGYLLLTSDQGSICLELEPSPHLGLYSLNDRITTLLYAVFSPCIFLALLGLRVRFSWLPWVSRLAYHDGLSLLRLLVQWQMVAPLEHVKLVKTGKVDDHRGLRECEKLLRELLPRVNKDVEIINDGPDIYIPKKARKAHAKAAKADAAKADDGTVALLDYAEASTVMDTPQYTIHLKTDKITASETELLDDNDHFFISLVGFGALDLAESDAGRKMLLVLRNPKGAKDRRSLIDSVYYALLR